MNTQTQEIVVEDVFPHTPETIWMTLTNGALMARWLGMTPTGFEAVTGNRFTLQTTPAGAWDGVIHCQVLEVIANKRLVYAWKGGDEANAGYGSKLDTVVTFSLSRVANGTRLRVVHSGFVLPKNRTAFTNLGNGWKKVVKRVGRFGNGGFDMRVLELEPTRHVLWRVVDGPQEWIGTTISWDIQSNGDWIIVLFKHEGWRGPVEFMHHCSTKWAVFLLSLKSLLETGKGAITALAGPDDPISRGPNPGTKLDWEVELAIVVGRQAQDIAAAEAAGYIFGYVCINDVSDRATQVDAEGGQHLVRAKSRPGYAPIGPYLTTGVDGMNLDLWTKVNGRYEQQGNTSDMLFSISEMLAYFSAHMTLQDGDRSPS